jgi:hypothetical protein
VATGYVRLRINWGGLDITAAEAESPSYGPTQIVSGGPSAVVGSGVGVRRCSLVFDRTALNPGADNAIMHFDFLNTTGGAPDDTWTAADFVALETPIVSMINGLKAYIPGSWKLTELDWHRVGSGIGKPNPAERQYLLPVPIACIGVNTLPPQAACSITFRTGVRHSWGRTYLPLGVTLGSDQFLQSTAVDAIAGAVHTMVQAAAAADFLLVVVSESLHSALVVERIEVDNVTDIIRRRRWKKSTYRKMLP